MFKRNRDFSPTGSGVTPRRPKKRWRMLPHLTTISGQWLLLFAGRQPLLPDDPHVQRVLARLQSQSLDVTRGSLVAWSRPCSVRRFIFLITAGPRVWSRIRCATSAPCDRNARFPTGVAA